jgi:hypothetical protein
MPAGGAEGKRRFANIRKLMRMAADFEALEGPDLAGFVGLIGSLDELGDTEGNAPSLAEGENVVRVMTVHQAKGLEFPAVVLAGLGSPGRNDTTDEFVLGHDGRIAAVVKEKQDRYEEFHPHWGPAPEIIADEKRREDEEDIRLLYVAMTRAKDRLFLVGARPRGDKIAGTPIGSIVAGLGLDSFPESGSAVVLDDIGAAVVSVGYSHDGDEETDAQDEQSVVQRAGEQAPEPTCFLRLEKPGVVSPRISFSALSAFGRCPRRFYLERVLGLGYLLGPAVGDADPDTARADDSPLDDVETDTGRDVGLLVHSLLEQIDLSGGRPALETLCEQAGAQAGAAGLALSNDGIRRAADLVGAFWDSLLAGDPEIDSALREEAFIFVHDGMTVHGVMDLLCHGEPLAHRRLQVELPGGAHSVGSGGDLSAPGRGVLPCRSQGRSAGGTHGVPLSREAGAAGCRRIHVRGPMPTGGPARRGPGRDKTRRIPNGGRRRLRRLRGRGPLSVHGPPSGDGIE